MHASIDPDQSIPSLPEVFITKEQNQLNLQVSFVILSVYDVQ